MEYVSIKSRVLGTLRTRKRPVSAKELTQKLDGPSQQTIYSTLSQLRKEGYRIVATQAKDGLNRYSLQA